MADQYTGSGLFSRRQSERVEKPNKERSVESEKDEGEEQEPKHGG